MLDQDESATIVLAEKEPNPMTQPHIGRKYEHRHYMRLALNTEILMNWLKGQAAPELANVRGEDKGVYAISSVLRNCGTEMYTLATARHIIAFPEFERGREFSRVRQDA